MPLKLSLGSTTTAELDISSDLSKHFLEEAGSITAKIPEIPNDAVSEIPPQFATLGFNFSAAPSWKIPQVAAITLTVKPQAGCKIAFLKSGATMCQFTTGAESPQQNPIKVRDGHCCVSISLSCSIGLEVGAKFSNGALGVSGSASADEQFRITYHHQVLPTTKVHDAISEAFRRFRLPFHSDGIDDMQDGSYLDAEFVGNLALGFGVTYGFAGIQLAGTSTGNVQAAANTPIGREVLTTSPTVKVDAAFKLTYTHQDDFRLVAGRTNIAGDNKVTLYLMRKDVATLSSTESVGITLKAGAKFQTDPTTLNREIGLATQPYLGSTAGPLGIKLASAADPLATDVNSSVNQLLSKGDGQKMVLELMQSRASQDTALFIYALDFTRPDKSGQRAYDLAMGGDYASAIQESGAKLDPRSFVEQQYLTSAGIHLQLFGLLNFQDVTKYIDQNDVTYIGSRTFQIRSTEGVTEISGTSKKSQEADLYFVAECRNVSGSTAVSGASVKLQAIFIDKGIGEAFDHSARALAALGRGEEAESIRGYAHLAPHGTVRLAFNVPSQLFGKLQSDDYQNGHPAAEPHQKDQANYEAFTHAFADTYRLPDPTNEISSAPSARTRNG